MNVSKLMAYCMAALGAWTTYLQVVSGHYMRLISFHKKTSQSSQFPTGLLVEIVQTNPKTYIMAFYMGGNEGPDALFERCLPEKNLKKNSEQNSDVTYEVTFELVNS